MLDWDDNTRKKLTETNNNITELLLNTTTTAGTSWLDLYNQWIQENQYEFIAYLQDGFNELPPKEILNYDPSDPWCKLFFDNISMSVFISKQFVTYSRDIVTATIEMHPDDKISFIKKYFDFIEESSKFDNATILMNGLASESGVLQGEHPVDIPPVTYFLHETIDMYSIESIYLLSTYWRITSDTDYLQKMVNSVARYIREYFKENGKDPEMHLDWPLEEQSIIRQINTISWWIERIYYHTCSMLEEYKKRNWFISVDKLADELSFPPFISYFEMLRFKYLYPDAENETVANKAKYFHRYGVWIKTVDVINTLSEVASYIYRLPDEEIQKFGESRKALLELANNLKTLKEHFSAQLFTHKEFYDSLRQKYSFLSLETYEQNARKVNSSINDLIQFTDGMLSNNIDTLLNSKQQFVSRISGFLSEEQKLKLDEYMTKVIEKIKEEIRKLNIYANLYQSIENDFQQYAAHLSSYPDIFCSLVSAEYLYNQYVEGKQPNSRFDYSCISILYYMALEDFANKLLYTPYSANILNANTNAVRQNYRQYISSNTLYWDNRNRCYKRTCEIGNLGHLFKELNVEIHFKNYLQTLYPNIDIPKLISFGTKLINIAPRRNDAAHGGNLITYNDVCIDKQNVYSTINTYRRLIKELFSIIFPN